MATESSQSEAMPREGLPSPAPDVLRRGKFARNAQGCWPPPGAKRRTWNISLRAAKKLRGSSSVVLSHQVCGAREWAAGTESGRWKPVPRQSPAARGSRCSERLVSSLPRTFPEDDWLCVVWISHWVLPWNTQKKSGPISLKKA